MKSVLAHDLWEYAREQSDELRDFIACFAGNPELTGRLGKIRCGRSFKSARTQTTFITVGPKRQPDPQDADFSF